MSRIYGRTNKVKQVEQYRKQREELEKQIKPENRMYYKNLTSYTMFAGFTHDETELEEQLLMILNDIIKAQEDGISAEKYFGKNPQESADQIIANLSKSSFKDRSTLVMIIVGIVWICKFIADVNQDSVMQINWLTYLLEGAFSVGFIFIVFKFFQKMVYQENRWLKDQRVQFAILFLVIVAWLAASISMAIFMPMFYPITIPFPFDLVIIGVLMLAALIFVLRLKESVFYSMIFLFEALGILGILQRLSANGIIAKVPASVTLFFLMAAYMIYTFWTIRETRKLKRKN